ncbi:unnamed protein product [Adineta ricciae]|uniref:Uncharacterized protein n=1 Tax=Adineta ricciae TaxID=249248 RepID=A0A813TKI1_ADIRI|nr:unnamed protein product [Adineta ricciae]
MTKEKKRKYKSSIPFAKLRTLINFKTWHSHLFFHLLFLLVFLFCNRPRSNVVLALNELLFTVMNGQYQTILQEAESIRNRLLSNCATSRECRLAAEQIRKVFLNHPVSSKYYDDASDNDPPRYETASIFKWG